MRTMNLFTFISINLIKSKLSNRRTDEILEFYLKLKTTKYKPDLSKLSKALQIFIVHINECFVMLTI